MRTATRIGICTAVGTLAVLLTGCTTHYYGRPDPKPLPPGQVRKYETYGHQKTRHVPPGQAKKQPVAVQQQQHSVQVQQQVTNVRVTMHDSPAMRQPVAAPAPAAAPAAPATVVQVTHDTTYAGTSQHVPPGQLRKQDTYGHQKQRNVPPVQARKDESPAPQREPAQKAHKQEHKQEVKQAHKQEQPQQTSRGQAKNADSAQEQDEQDAPRGNGKKTGKK